MIILDTHVILWNALSPEKISKKAKEIIFEAEDTLFFAKFHFGKLQCL